MAQFIVSLVGGIALGGSLALIALGMIFAYRATNTLTFAQGELMLLPAFLVGAWQAGNVLPFWLSFLLAMLISAGICVLFYFLVLQRTIGLPPFIGFVATLGLASMIDGFIALKYGAQQYSLQIPGMPSGSVRVFGSLVQSSSLAIAGFTLALSAVIIGVMRFTDLGVRIRAAGQDAVLASQGGIRVRRIYAASWAIAGMLACLAGLAYASATIVAPSIEDIALAAIPVMLLGGFDSIEGAALGGLIIGVLQNMVASYLGGQYTDVATYTLLLVILVLRPQGLFGTRQVVRA
jgi:branched-chain amino acid transport system permease protein